MSKTTVYIDFDILKYKIGFACQKTVYKYIKDGTEIEGKKKAKEWFEENGFGEWVDDEWESYIRIEPWESVQFLIDSMLAEIMQKTKADNLVLCTSPHTCFRDEISVTKPYKGNRNSPKPEYAKQILEYAAANYDLVQGDNIEADDVMGMSQDTTTIIASTDKDLDQIPGAHYNFDTKEEYYVDKLYGDFRFFVQLIAGDGVDNIQGIQGIGEKTAIKIVEQFDGNTAGLVAEIKDMYEFHYDDQWEDKLKEMAALVWILRSGETPETAGWRDLLGYTSDGVSG